MTCSTNLFFKHKLETSTHLKCNRSNKAFYSLSYLEGHYIAPARHNKRFSPAQDIVAGEIA